MKKIVAHSLYTIKDQYFEDFPSPYWLWNKSQKRPYYHLMKDKDDILWVIPLSSQVQNYSKKIELYERKYGSGKCVYYHTGVLASKTSVFKICQMFPIDESYINAPFTIKGTHYVVKNKNLCSALQSKAMKYLKLVETGAIKSNLLIMDIKKTLLKRRYEFEYNG